MSAEWSSLTTQERIALVQAHHTPEGSALKIARSIGMGVTRNVIMGVYHRYPSLKLTHPLGGNVGKVPGGARQAARTEPVRQYVRVHRQELIPQTPRPVAPMRPEFRHIDLLELKSGECKWPDGDRPVTFCGAPADGSYCAYHARLAIDPNRARTR